MKQIYWGCCSLFIPSLFIKLGPPANIFPPTVSKLEIFPSLQLNGPLFKGSPVPRQAEETCSSPCAAGWEAEKPSQVLLQIMGHIFITGMTFQKFPSVHTTVPLDQTK